MASKRADLDDFVACYSAKDRTKRKENKRRKPFACEELFKREKVNLDLLTRSFPLTPALALRSAQPVSLVSRRLGSGSKTSPSKAAPTSPLPTFSPAKSPKTSRPRWSSSPRLRKT